MSLRTIMIGAVLALAGGLPACSSEGAADGTGPDADPDLEQSSAASTGTCGSTLGPAIPISKQMWITASRWIMSDMNGLDDGVPPEYKPNDLLFFQLGRDGNFSGQAIATGDSKHGYTLKQVVGSYSVRIHKGGYWLAFNASGQCRIRTYGNADPGVRMYMGGRWMNFDSLDQPGKKCHLDMEPGDNKTFELACKPM